MAFTGATAEDRVQPDGRRRVVEVYTDHLGQAQRVEYLAEADYDIAAHRAERSAALTAQAVDQELASNIASILAEQPAITADFISLDETHAQLVAFFGASAGVDTALYASYFLTLDDKTLASAFAIDALDVPALRIKLTLLRDDWLIVKAGKGGDVVPGVVPLAEI